MVNREQREDEVWKLNDHKGIIVGDDGLLYSYLKLGYFLEIIEVNAVGFTQEIVDSHATMYLAGFDVALYVDAVPDNALEFLYISDEPDYTLN